MTLCKLCREKGYANCYECVWTEEAEYAKIEIIKYQQDKKHKKWIKTIKQILGGEDV